MKRVWVCELAPPRLHLWEQHVHIMLKTSREVVCRVNAAAQTGQSCNSKDGNVAAECCARSWDVGSCDFTNGMVTGDRVRLLDKRETASEMYFTPYESE